MSAQNGPPGTETDEFGRAGEVQFDGFGLLSGQKTTRGRARSTAQQTKAGELRLGSFTL